MTPSPIKGTGLSVVTNKTWSLRLFYQSPNGHIDQSKHLDGVWTNEQLTFSAINGSPLASISYNSGKELRIYYLDASCIVQEYCYSEGRGWYHGEIGNMKAKAAAASGLTAIVFGSDVFGHGPKGLHIRVYYQEAGSNTIAELANDGSWHTGDMRISDAIGDTYIAALAYWFQDQTQIRVYYQDRDHCLKEYCHNNDGWFQGGFNPGKASAHTPICAVVYGSVAVQVFYRDTENRAAYVKNTGSWGSPKAIEPIDPASKLAVLQWDNGSRFRLYFQDSQGLAELCSDDGGNSWFWGEFRVTSH
jgi:hypothetical protein